MTDDDKQAVREVLHLLRAIAETLARIEARQRQWDEQGMPLAERQR